MTKRINIRAANGVSVGHLEPHPTGNGFVGVCANGEPSIPYYAANEHDAIMFFSRALEGHGYKLSSPSTMYGWNLFRDSNGFFVCMPYPPSNVDDLLMDNISAYQGWDISKRANEVRSFFGPQMNKCTLEQVWQLEAKMKEVSPS